MPLAAVLLYTPETRVVTKLPWGLVPFPVSCFNQVFDCLVGFFRIVFILKYAVLFFLVMSPLAWSQPPAFWPGWRGNGTGVTSETGYLQTWTPTQNVLWYTAIPGEGHSSPIVWEDFVLVTTAVEGTQAGWIRSGSYYLYWLLGLLMASWYLARITENPLFRTQPVKRLPGFPMRILLVVLTAVAIFVFLILGKWAFWRFPELGDLWGKPGELYAYFFKEPVGMKWGSLCSLFLAGTLLFTKSFLKLPGRLHSVREKQTGFFRFLFAQGEAFLVSFMFLLFMVYLVTFILVAHNPEFNTRMWMRTAGFSFLGLGVTFSGVPRTSRWSLAGPILVVILLIVTWVALPGPLLGMGRSRMIGFVVSAALGLVSCSWFAGQAWRLRAGGFTSKFPMGPTATLALTLLYFTVTNFVLPKATLQRQVLCLDARNGEILWQTVVAVTNLEGLHPANSAATPTPVTDGQHIYVHFGDSGAYCLDFQGKLVWENRDPVPPIHWGAASSPVLWEDLLFLTHDTDFLNYTVALDKKTGKRTWINERELAPGERYASMDGYSTPIVMPFNGSDQLVHYRTTLLAGYNPRTGEELWRWRNPGWQVITSPVYRDNLIVATCGAHKPVLMAVLALVEGAREPEVLWQTKEDLPGTSSPLIHGNLLFTVTDRGIARCYDLETGSLRWREKLPRDEYWSSLVATGDTIYFTGRSGTALAVRADEHFQLLGTGTIEEPIHASPALSRGRLFLRGRHHLFCIAAKDTGP